MKVCNPSERSPLGATPLPRFMLLKTSHHRFLPFSKQRPSYSLFGNGLMCMVGLGLNAVAANPCWGQALTAQLRGTVVSEETGRPLQSVVVVLTGPSLAMQQTDVTDKAGNYVITQLPPGEGYQISFYRGDGRPCRVQPGIRLSPGKTLGLDARLGSSCRQDSLLVIRETAPNVDVASSFVGAEVDQKLLTYAPSRGRTFESALALAPGAADVAPRSSNYNYFNVSGGDVGVSLAGATGVENNYIIDGLNGTDPYLGVVGTELSQYFIHDISIQVGGYTAEYGRATGGVISIITKSGSNETHGGVYGSGQPFQLDPLGVARLGESLVTRTSGNGAAFDIGADLGGPLLRDRIHYYIGFAATSTTTRIERRGRRLTPDATGNPEPLADYECPSYLANPALCVGARALALHTDEIEYRQDPEYVRRLYNGIIKLDFSIDQNHRLTLSYLGSPSTFSGYNDVLSVDLASNQYSINKQLHDVSGHYLGKLLDRKLQIDLFYGFHYQDQKYNTNEPDVANIVYLAEATSPYSLADFESVSECRRYAPDSSHQFNPCPITKYSIGLGPYMDQTLYRHQVLASATYFLNLLGTHTIKLGVDFEDVRQARSASLTGRDVDPGDPTSGHRLYQTDPSGQLLYIAGELAQRGPNGETQPVNSTSSSLENRNYAVYLRDSWTVGFAPGLQVNVGARWEAQEIYRPDGQLAVGIYNNWSPRVGLVYDFTKRSQHSGRGKIFFHYGRMYESLPIYPSSVSFMSSGYAISNFSSTCPKQSRQPGGIALPVPAVECRFMSAVYGDSGTPIVPGLQGQFVNDITAGLNYDVGYDVVVGISYLHRDLGSVIDYLSIDDGNTVLLGNPGTAADPAHIQTLQDEVARLQRVAQAPGASSTEQNAYGAAQRQLATYQAQGALFSRPHRDYNALVLTVSKRLSHRFGLLANYTYSRTIGDYPGTFNGYNGVLSPNSSFQFVYAEARANRMGPLPTDRPHNLKLVGYYTQPLGSRGRLTAGMSLSVYSGRPIQVLASRAGFNGLMEIFVLPSGSGGRTPTVSQLDLRVSYEHELTRRVQLGLSVEVINLFDQRQVTNVDDLYTTSFVAPVRNGKPEDLQHLRALDGSLAVVNSNYGQPTAYQEPLYMRFGGRLTF